MAEYKIKFDNTPINESLQVNDNVYISGNLTESGGFNTASTPELVGPVTRIESNYIYVETDVTSFPPTSGTYFFSFIKNSIPAKDTSGITYGADGNPDQGYGGYDPGEGLTN